MARLMSITRITHGEGVLPNCNRTRNKAPGREAFSTGMAPVMIAGESSKGRHCHKRSDQDFRIGSDRQRPIQESTWEMGLSMTTKSRNIIAGILLSALLTATTATARAQVGYQVTKGTVAGVAAVIAGVGVGIGLGVYFAIRRNHSLTGCAVAGANGLELQNRGDQHSYALIGQLADIKPDDRVRVSGKKEKKEASAPQQFLVEKLNKNFGPCNAQPAMR
jgi:hypothetical protein